MQVKRWAQDGSDICKEKWLIRQCLEQACGSFQDLYNHLSFCGQITRIHLYYWYYCICQARYSSNTSPKNKQSNQVYGHCLLPIEILVRHISVKAPGYRLLLLIFELLTHHDFMIAAREINDYFIFLVRKKRVDCFLALIGNPILEGLRLLIVLIIIMGYDTAWSAHH